MDQLLLKKNGKTICWRKLTIEDEDEVEKLMKEYCKNEPMYAIRYSAESEAKAMETSKVRHNVFKVNQLYPDHDAASLNKALYDDYFCFVARTSCKFTGKNSAVATGGQGAVPP